MIHICAGYSATDLISAWGREATAVLSLRNRGEMEIDAFKVVAERVVSFFHLCLLFDDSNPSSWVAISAESR